MSPTPSNVTTSHISVASLTCEGCDCGLCVSDVMTMLDETTGVVHVRVDRRQRAFVVRHETGLEAGILASVVAGSKLAVTSTSSVDPTAS